MPAPVQQAHRTVESPGAYAEDGQLTGYYDEGARQQRQRAGSGSASSSRARGDGSNGRRRRKAGDSEEGEDNNEDDDDDDNEDGDEDAGNDSERNLARHGLESSDEILNELQNRYFLYYNDVRHASQGRAKPFPYFSPPDWRSKDKVKIVHGALVVCLRIGFDPPDVVKPSPAARLEAWVDTVAIGKERAMETITANLNKQFDSLAVSSKAKFQMYMDPAHEDLRKLCIGLRRKTRNDRALFHYNGHGVPRPTASGEIWVFNRQYTQYIPVNIADIVGYLGGPCVYLWDCSNAGNIVNKIVELQNLPEGKFPAFSASTAPAAPPASKSSDPNNPNLAGGTSTPTADSTIPSVSIASIQDIVQLAACQAHESLPMNPDLPADLFTSCITSPIEMSVRYFLLHNPMKTEDSLPLDAKVPGKLTDRKTPIGELIWIFTSVTDTIAWNMVPRHLFQRLFRHDLVLAAVFRGFLLAERIMRRYNCTPISVPAIPACYNHPLWDSWDLALDRCLSQIPALQKYDKAKTQAELAGDPPPPKLDFNHSFFFSDHLSAFSVWIEQGTARTVDASLAYNGRGEILKSGHRRTLPPSFTKPGPPEVPQVVLNGEGGHHRHTGERGAGGHKHDNHHGHAHKVNGSSNGEAAGPMSRTSSTTHTKGSIPIAVGQLKRAHKTLRVAAEQPEHLPILLQVLLSQVHRLRALMLLCKFLDLGAWAVNLSLGIGIFPYVLKLLQAPGPELRPVLVYIWTRILAIYRLCQEDLAKAAGLPTARNGGKPELPFHYFAALLDPHQQMLVIPNVSEHRAMCSFIISIFMRDYPYGQQLALTSIPANAKSNVLESSLFHLHDEDPLLRQWSAITIGVLWDDFDEAKGLGVKLKAHSDLTTQMHSDPTPEVRAACLFALGVFIGTTAGDLLTGKSNAGRSLSSSATERTSLSEQWQADEELGVPMSILKMQSDGSPMVRKELVVLLSAIVYNHRGSFVVAAYDNAIERRERTRYAATEIFEDRLRVMEESLKTMDQTQERPSTYSADFRSIMFGAMYRALLDLACDPFPAVSERGKIVVDYIHEHLLNSDLPTANPAMGRSEGSDVDENSDSDSTRYGTNTTGSANSNSQSPVLTIEKPKPTLMSAFKALTKMGLADVHAPRHPQAAKGRPSSPAPTASIATSRSVANFGDSASVQRALRHVSSADSLLHAATSNSARFSAESSRSDTTRSDTPSVSVSEAKEALFRMDAERQRRARQTPAPVVVTPARIASSVPLAANPADPPPPFPPYVPSPTVSEEITGKPTSTEMPLRSEFFDWSTEYFINPQMKEKESDEPGSIEYSERHWRRERNEKVILATQPQKETAGEARWDQLDAELDNSATPEIVAFHQFEPTIAAADAQGTLRIYDWQQRRLVNRFANVNIADNRFEARAKITTLKFINDDDIALLLTGTLDGCVRVFRDYEQPKPTLVTAWRALPQLLASTNAEAGLVSEWQQSRGRLIAGGNAKEIRLWDASTEVCTREISTRSNSCVTSITSDQVAGDMIVAGFGDGAVRVYDARLPPRETVVRSYRGFHRSWVKNIHMQRGGNRELVSGGLTGEVCVWDIRESEPLRVVQAHQGGLTAMAVHEHAPVFATGSEAGIVKVWNILEDEPISRFRNTGVPKAAFAREGTLHPVVSMMFHPHEMVLGVGATDAKLNMYHCQV